MIEPKWTYKDVSDSIVEGLSKEFDIPISIATVMSLRGVVSRELSRNYFYPDSDQMHDPFLMQDMEKTVDRILKQKENSGTILIFGDYDVDGTSGTSILFLFLKSIGIETHFYIPDRENEGYGVSKKGIEYAKLIGADLIITCDCGINAFEQVDFANKLGVDIIITDHHKQAETLPTAFSILNPNRNDCSYPFKGLCGAGVAFKLGLAICEKGGHDPELIWEHSDLAAIGTAADMVPIVDENRVIVSHGIKRIAKGYKPGVRALLQTGGLWGKDITVGRLVFWFSPKINAAGRLGDAGRAVKLMTTQNPNYAMEISRELEKENDRRKEITQRMVEEAIYMVNSTCDLETEKAIILANPGWHHGVIGIVASRIKELFYKPAVIISMNGKEGKGSCRSIPRFDMVEALTACAEYLEGFGGHPIAAGLTVSKDQYDQFKHSLLKIADEKITEDELVPRLSIDVDIMLSEVNGRFLRFLKALEPYGPGNMRPVFTSKSLSVSGLPKLIGKNHDVLKFKVKQDQTIFEAIGFGMAEHYDKLIRNQPIDIAYSVGENEWKGEKTIQLEVKDIKLGVGYA